VEQRYRRSLELGLLKGTSRWAQLDNFINATQRLPPGIRLLIRSLASLALGGVKALTSRLVSTILNTAVGNLLPPDSVLKLLRSRTFYGSETYGSSSICMNVYGVLDAGPEFRLTRYLLRFLRDDEVFYDVGAHVGFYTLLASYILRSGRVYGFEPNPYVYRALKANIIGISNAAAYPYAVSDRVGAVELKIPAISNASTGFTTLSSLRAVHEAVFKIEEKNVRKIAVPSITIDFFVSRVGDPPTFIKIDVEGSEDLVVRGAIETLKNHHPKIAMEIWRIPGETPHKRAAETLYRLGYRSYAITGKGDLIEVDFQKARSEYQLGFIDNIIFL
jgi:FkbM family methyltransferase